MDKLQKLLDYVTEQENRYYDYAHKAMDKDNMLSNMVNSAQATAFQRVRYAIEQMLEEGAVE